MVEAGQSNNVSGGATSQGLWLTSRSWKGQGTNSPSEFPERMQCQHLHFRNSYLQNYKRMKVCCLEPLSCWWLVIAATGHSYPPVSRSLFWRPLSSTRRAENFQRAQRISDFFFSGRFSLPFPEVAWSSSGISCVESPAPHSSASHMSQTSSKMINLISKLTDN